MKIRSPEGVDAGPFEIVPEAGSNIHGAALCLHGLTGTPYEVRSLAEELARKGFHCQGPVQPGHHEWAQELARTPYTAWLAHAREEIQKCRSRSDFVLVVGMSMGGVVSLAMAEEGLVDAIVVVGTPIQFSRRLRVAINLGRYLRPYLAKQGGSDIQDPVARGRHPGFSVMPLAAVQQLIKMQRVVRKDLRKITVPILVAHGALDKTADPRDATTIIGNVSSQERELHTFERSGHVVPVDHDGHALAEVVGGFAQRCARDH